MAGKKTKNTDTSFKYCHATLQRHFSFLILLLFLKTPCYHQLLSKTLKYLKKLILYNLSCCFLKNDTKLLAKPITDLCNLSINSGKIHDSCKIAKPKPIHRKGSLHITTALSLNTTTCLYLSYY